ncbi:MAG TPA: TetR/AcrR family transcriptional regulator [Candidatus Acidoferrales bacterium]|nr:TetR/AcrR family transcriptional regulator [Candidatus Acidoferrales bacterium]
MDVAFVNMPEYNLFGTMRRRPYHHGNLREALLEGAVRVIAELGPAAFTLREVARRAGVSHNAPYRHFRDKDAILAAVAAQGFRELTRAMRAAAGKKSGALDKLKQSGLAYVAFAIRRPEHFTVMFDSPVRGNKDPEYVQASEECFHTLVTFIGNCQEEGQLPAGNTLDRALYAWSLVHGIAKLAIAGRLPFPKKSAMLKFAEFAIDQSVSSA